MATQLDYYEILSVSRDADFEQIKRSYRKLAMKYHPDRNPDDAEAERHFKQCAEAYEVLSNPEKRKRYDQFGHAGLRGTSGHDFSHMDPNDIFSIFGDLFEGVMGGGRRRNGRQGRAARRGYDLETHEQLTLEQVATGIEREIEFTRQDLCTTCSGSGAKPGSTPERCGACGGSGQVAQSGLGGMFRMVTTCAACRGEGTTIKDKCPQCHGSGRQPKKRKIQVKIPPGIHQGQAIRVPGEGEPGQNGGPPGDLHVAVSVEPHHLFARENDHLIMKMPVSFTQAALGANVQIPTLIDGEEELTIPPGSQHGRMFKISHKGLPNLRSGQRGDLVVMMLVEIPKKLSHEQEQLLRDFAQTEDHQVMPESHGFWSKIKQYISCI